MNKYIRLLFLFLAITCLVIPNNASAIVGAKGATSLTGGASGSLDSFDGATLNDGDMAFVSSGNTLYIYKLDSDSGLTEASPFIVSPDSSAGNKRWILQNKNADYYCPDYIATDQGLTGNSNTIKYLVDTIGSTNKATIYLRHNSGSANTDYTFSTNETIPSNITLVLETGARLAVATGITVTINGDIEAGTQQIFSLAGTGSVNLETSLIKEVYLEWWGGGVNATAATNVAVFNLLCNSGTSLPIRLLSGTYNFSSNIYVYNVSSLRGTSSTILKPTAAVTGIFLSIDNQNEWADIGGFIIDGILTTNVTGMSVGTKYAPATVSDRIYLSDINCYRFKKGIIINWIIYLDMQRCNFRLNGSNEITRTVAASSNIVNINNCSFMESSATLGTGIGLFITQGLAINITNTDFESNDKEGLKIVPEADGFVSIIVGDGCWFEANHASEANPENFYNIYIDATLGAVYEAVDFTLRGATFLINSGATLKSRVAYLKEVDNFLIEPIKIIPFATAVYLDIFFFDGGNKGKITMNRSPGKWRQCIKLAGLNHIEADEPLNYEELADINRAVNTATRDIAIGSLFRTVDTVPTTVTKFTGSFFHKKIVVVAGNANTTFDFSSGTYLIGNGGVDWTPSAGDWMECVGNPNDYESFLCDVHEI